MNLLMSEIQRLKNFVSRVSNDDIRNGLNGILASIEVLAHQVDRALAANPSAPLVLAGPKPYFLVSEPHDESGWYYWNRDFTKKFGPYSYESTVREYAEREHGGAVGAAVDLTPEASAQGEKLLDEAPGPAPATEGLYQRPAPGTFLRSTTPESVNLTIQNHLDTKVETGASVDDADADKRWIFLRFLPTDRSVRVRLDYVDTPASPLRIGSDGLKAGDLVVVDEETGLVQPLPKKTP